jgi:hypothetical protein
MLVQGVLSGPRERIGWLRVLWYLLTGRLFYEQGYRVGGPAALAVLQERDASAEAWWRANAPHLVGAGSVLVFHASVCQPIED